jgi:hypothetical protein
MHWGVALALCLMAGGAAGDVTATCNASITSINGTICPSLPSGAGDPIVVPGWNGTLELLGITFMTPTFDATGLLSLVVHTRFDSGASPISLCTMSSINPPYSFVGFSMYFAASLEIVQVSLYTNYPGATQASRWKTKLDCALSGTLPTTTAITYFCPSGSVIQGFYFAYNNDKDTKRINNLASICLPLVCPATQYPSPDASSCLPCPVGTYTLGTSRDNYENFMPSCDPCTNGYPVGAPQAAVYTSSGASADGCSFACNAGYGQTNSVGGSLALCGPCLAGFYSASQGAACSGCPPGSYSDSTGMSYCKSCTLGVTFQPLSSQSSCTGPCTSPSPIAGYYWIACTLSSNANTLACPACSAGSYLSPACGQTGYGVPACTACPAGKYQKNPIVSGDPVSTAYTCTPCAPGSYQDQPGQIACKTCGNAAPANGQYASATSISQYACPTQCNMGFGWTGSACVACPKGKYAPGGLPEVACVACSRTLDRNAYWLTPVTFNSGYDGCPWDCNAGYYSVSTGGCVACPYPTYSPAASLRAADSAPPNQCVACDACTPGVTYETRACNATNDRVCSPCASQCQSGTYIVPCSGTQNTQCVPCNHCLSGQYIITACSGQVCNMCCLG